MTSRMICVSLLACTLHVCGCPWHTTPTPPAVTRYTCIELTARETSEPAVGAQLTVARLETGYAYAQLGDGVPTPAAPTDETGEVCFPVTSRAFFDGTLSISVAGPEQEETVDVANEIGAEAEGDTLRVRVRTVDGDAPPWSACVDFGSDPPVIHVNGYMRSISICENGTGVREWGIRSPLDFPYVTTVVVGDVPDEFTDVTDEGTWDCAVSPSGDDVRFVVIEHTGASTENKIAPDCGR